MDERYTSTNLAWLSRIMAVLSTLGFVILPLVVAVSLIFPHRFDWMMFNIDHLDADTISRAPLPWRLGALACEAVPVAFRMWALWSLRQLFLRYAAGDVFSGETFRYLNNVAVALFASVVVDFVMGAPISALMTWPLGPGHRAISLSFGSDDVATLFTAGVILVIARVMLEARRMADENARFV